MGRSPLTLLAGKGPLFLVAGVAIGLAAPPLAMMVRPVISWTVVILLVTTFLRLDWAELQAQARRPGLAIAVVFILMALTPVAMDGLAGLLDLPPALHAAMVLMAALPPITSAAAFALMLGLNAGLSLVMSVIALAAVPLTIPAAAFYLLGLDLPIDPGGLAARLAAVTGGSMIAAFVLRRFLGGERLERNRDEIDGAAVLCLMVFAIGVMDGITGLLIERPAFVLGYIAAAFGANLLLQAGALAVLWWRGRKLALTVALSAGNRNMALLLATLPPETDPNLTIYFALGQIPIYLLPLATAHAFRQTLATRATPACRNDAGS